MAEPGDFMLRFWGVRGSIACPGIDTVRYGGNTSCLEIRCGSQLLIFDGGTGLRPFGKSLLNRGPVDADVFFTHTHFDHVCGLPFFSSVYNPQNRFRMYAGHLLPKLRLKDVLAASMAAPLFPVSLDVMRATIEFNDFAGGITLEPRPGVTVRTAPLNHPNRATGYRVEYEGRAICYVTDTEHSVGKTDDNVLGLIKGADLFVYDCTYTDEEFPKHVGWGHSTWQEGARLADLAGVGTLIIFHHDPAHDDEFMDRISAQASLTRPGTLVAREGLILRI